MEILQLRTVELEQHRYNADEWWELGCFIQYKDETIPIFI